MNEIELRDSIDCLFVLDEEIAVLFETYESCYKEHLADVDDELKWNIATIVASYLLIKICVFRDEVEKYFLKEGGGGSGTKEYLEKLNKLMGANPVDSTDLGIFDIKTTRDSMFAHNRLKVKGRGYRPLTSEEIGKFNLPRSIEQFEIILGVIDCIMMDVEHELKFLDELWNDDGKEFDELEKFLSEGGDIEKLIQKEAEEFDDIKQEQIFKEGKEDNRIIIGGFDPLAMDL